LLNYEYILIRKDIKYPRRLDVEKSVNVLGVKLRHLIPAEDKFKTQILQRK